MIRIERVFLPEGLKAVAYRDQDGNLVVCVSQELDSASQRAAVVDAMRAARRVGWRAGLPPAGIALFLGARALLRRVSRPLQAHPAAWGTAAAATVTAAAVSSYFLVTPPGASGPTAGAQPGPSAVAPAPSPARPRAHPSEPGTRPGHAGTPGHTAVGSPLSDLATPGPAPGKTQPKPAPAGPPGPTPSPSPSPQPTPAPTPTPSTGGGLCVRILGVKVCLRV
jgi:hypothetical protein